MGKRFVSIWFRYLHTDWFSLRHPEFHDIPFVLTLPDHGRLVISAANLRAQKEGVHVGMVVADARASFPAIKVCDDKAGLSNKLLTRIAEWCIRYSPYVAIDPPDGLILDASGCAHLWGGEKEYLENILITLKGLGYTIQCAMADTIGSAWAFARFGSGAVVISPGCHIEAILRLPPSALRLNHESVERLDKLGLRDIRSFITMPRSALRRRFGEELLLRLDQAVGKQEEIIQPVHPVEPYQERLPCLEPIVTVVGIEYALRTLIERLCSRLKAEEKGLRRGVLTGYRVDGKIEKIEISTSRATYNQAHLFKLFELKIQLIEPALGIEIFLLEAPKVEDVTPLQEKIWEGSCGLENIGLAELLDKITGRFGSNLIKRLIPDEHYWPERSVKPAQSLQEKLTTGWKIDKPRPVKLLPVPEKVDVTAPIPDYPPMLFRYRGKLHKVVKADGPERIEQEWWLQQGQHRDYYYVEDEEGKRYWLFRLGHYDEEKSYQWFIHGFFA